VAEALELLVEMEMETSLEQEALVEMD